MTAVLLLTLAALAACSEDPSSAGGDTLERARASDTLRVGYANEALYAYRDRLPGS